MKNMLIVLLGLLMCSTCYASPEGEIWKYHTEMQGYEGYMVYAFRDGNTYLGQCDNLLKPLECSYYKIPCSVYSDGFVCSAYSELLQYAFAFQCIGGSCGFMHSLFGFNFAIEFFTVYYAIPFWPLIFDLNMIGNFDEVPPDNIFQTFPEELL